MAELTKEQIAALQLINPPPGIFSLYDAVMLDSYKSLEWVYVQYRSRMPSLPAVYFLYDSGNLFYVGSSSNPRKRWGRHEQMVKAAIAGIDPSTARIGWINCPESILIYLEDFYIQRFEPLCNQRRSKQNC